MTSRTRRINCSGNNSNVERRSHARIPIQEELRYRVVDHGDSSPDGYGTTVDMSRCGICFQTTGTPPSEGRLLEVSVNWPVKLEDTCLLKLVAVGRVVRSSGQVAVLGIDKYEFRTRGKASGCGRS